MKLYPPDPTLRFIAIIDDCDSDDIDITYYATREAAEAYVLDQYTGSDCKTFPDTTELDGEMYTADERPNARIYIAELLARTTL